MILRVQFIHNPPIFGYSAVWTVRGGGLNSVSSGQSPLVSSCIHGNKPVKGEEFLGQFSVYQLLEKSSVTWSNIDYCILISRTITKCNLSAYRTV
jgi:hypothetical protein